jgi:hypothetical protein
MPIVSTGQITIVDTNDARPITAYLTSNPGTQQVYTKDESSISYTPSWFTANASTGIELRGRVYVGTPTGNQDVTPILSNRKFCLTVGGTALANGTTSTDFVNDIDGALTTPFTIVNDGTQSYLRIKGNLKDSVAQFNVFFEGDYTDPSTGLVSHTVAQITLSTVKTGTNAVYINTRGNDMIEVGVDSGTGAQKITYAAITADLLRPGGIDTTNVTYRWYEAATGNQINSTLSGVTTKYGMRTAAAGAIHLGVVGDMNQNIPVGAAGNAFNTLVISPAAIVDMGVIRVDITDNDAKIYSRSFTVYDVSDPYEVRLNSSTGDKLQNGVGNTIITPEVFYGAIRQTNTAGWTFTYQFWDKDGKRAAFIDTAKIALAGGAVIDTNTTGVSATFSLPEVTAGLFAAGDIIKCVKANGAAFYYEVAVPSTAGVVTIRTPTTNTWLNFTNFPAPAVANDFSLGRLYGCSGAKTGASITVTGDEIDVKGRIICEANRP